MRWEGSRWKVYIRPSSIAEFVHLYDELCWLVASSFSEETAIVTKNNVCAKVRVLFDVYTRWGARFD